MLAVLLVTQNKNGWIQFHDGVTNTSDHTHSKRYYSQIEEKNRYYCKLAALLASFKLASGASSY